MFFILDVYIGISSNDRRAPTGNCDLWGSNRKRLFKIKRGRGYLIPHFLATFTSKKITKATMMNVIKATRKPPTPNS